MTHFFNIQNDQKQVLLKKISKVIERYHLKSLLDIGAGQPLLALPLSQRVKKYVAVESSPNLAKQLRDANVSVVEGTFPKVNIQGTYDLVLASHAIPEESKLYGPFLKKMWEFVSPGGLLLVITFKGAVDDLSALASRFRKDWIDADISKYEAMLDTLSSFGEVKTEKIVSHSSANTSDDMADVLTFSIGGTEQEKAAYQPTLKHILEEEYKNNGRYIFPHEHLILSCTVAPRASLERAFLL